MHIQTRKTNSSDWSVSEVSPILEPAYCWRGITNCWTFQLESLSR